MASSPPTTNGTTTPDGHAHHHHRGRRLRHFFMPDGKKVHIALSPEEAESLRQRLTVISPDEPFDLVINGSPEHLHALRTAHSHHEQRREALKRTHGQTYNEFEHVREQLETLGDELHMLTDHAVSLDASFSKYGYSAHLRTYDDTSGTASSRSSISGQSHDDHEKRDWAAERRNGRIMKLYKKPVVRQYFHRGLLWRGSGLAEVASFELFVDLLFVGILAINGDHAADDTTGEELLRFCITFIMSWKIWSDLALIISWFETDDVIQRVSVLFIMACLLGLTTNMLNAFQGTYTQLVAFYLAARLFMGSYCLILARVIPMVRGMMIVQATIVVIPAALWIASTHVEMPIRLALIWIAIYLDLCAALSAIFIIRGARYFGKKVEAWMDRVFEFIPAINIEHKVERTNAFVTLVFGYAVVAIIYQNSASHWGVTAFYGKAVLGLVQTFCFNWIYFELDGDDLFAHAIRRSVFSSMIWNTAHIPFIMAFTLGGAALSKLVVATDCPNANLEALTESYMQKSELEIPIGLRWFYCGGLGIALCFMGIISLSHVHKESGGARLRKAYRLANRFCVCIIILCLPTAHRLNSLQLVSIVTGLLIWVLLLELWGASCPDESFFGEKVQCRYTAKLKLSKKDLHSAAKTGDTICVKDLSDKGEKGLYELS
ncbi:hypothetical protein BP6252_07926 [Coleophoma cylindrospora]|uniref:Low temperature requirement a protein n=1 Tax=Coleophoma cylindrospora TaxID=1849047 RepID=A0A3D8RBC7_9HELO|nr:hypothetical protein BP6252_07926 [Coleophoma cylindrospora]